MVDAKDEFAENYALVSLQAHTWYEQKYPLVSALSRPLISKKISGNRQPSRRGRSGSRLHR